MQFIAAHKSILWLGLRKYQAIFRDKALDFRGKILRKISILHLRTKWSFGILLQRGIAIFDCEAAALPGRFLPELGRPRGGHFFCAGLLAPEGVAFARCRYEPLMGL
jgi:hypothetical protein